MRLVRNGKWDWWETESEIGLERDREWDWFVIFGRLVCSKVRQWDREIVNKTSTQHELIYRDWEPKSDTRPVTQVLQDYNNTPRLHTKTRDTSTKRLLHFYSVTQVLQHSKTTRLQDNKTLRPQDSKTTSTTTLSLRDSESSVTQDAKTARPQRLRDYSTPIAPSFHTVLTWNRELNKNNNHT